MSLKEKILSDLKDALKAGDNFKASTLRMVLSAFQSKEIEKRGKGKEQILSDEEAIEVLLKEAKKRKEAAENFQKGSRGDLADKETKELGIVKDYLPEQLSDAEVEAAVIKAIENSGAKTVKDFGRAMAEALKGLKGKTDAPKISEMIKKRLS